MMSDCLRTSSCFSLHLLARHELAKMSWGKFHLREKINGDNYNFIKTLVIHRKAVLKKITQAFSEVCPKRVLDKIFDSIFRLQQGYLEALDWDSKYRFALPFYTLNTLEAGEYHASSYIDPTGRFNDLAWVNRFLADENQDIVHRFQFACFYCFEDDISNLWFIMKTSRQLPCKGDLGYIRGELGSIVGLWAYHLEDRYEKLVEECGDYAEGFNVCGLIDSIEGGHEYAARFFWSQCSDAERTRFLMESSFDVLVSAADNEYVEVIQFIYSLIPQGQRYKLFSENNPCRYDSNLILSCLLLSRFNETALNDILNYSFPIPRNIFQHLLLYLALSIERDENPIHKNIFAKLWNHLSTDEQKTFLEWESYIIIILIQAKAIDLLEQIIRPLPYSAKEKMLLHDFNDTGVFALNVLLKDGDYDTLLQYLICFLVDFDTNTQKFKIRVDACDFLDKFTESQSFTSWTSNKLSDLEKRKMNGILDCLRGSLNCLLYLGEQLDVHSQGQRSDGFTSFNFTGNSLPVNTYLETCTLIKNKFHINIKELLTKRPTPDKDVNKKKQKTS